MTNLDKNVVIGEIYNIPNTDVNRFYHFMKIKLNKLNLKQDLLQSQSQKSIFLPDSSYSKN